MIAEFGAQKAQKIQALQADLSVEREVARLFSQASASFGPVQSIIVNHGVWPTADQPVVKMSLDQWKSTIETNLTSSFLVSREYLKNLESASDALKAYASIIFIGSTAGKFGKSFYPIKRKTHADLQQGKRAMLIMQLQRAVVFQPCHILLMISCVFHFAAMMYGLTMTLKNEIVKIAPAGRVNSIGPGWVKTVRCTGHVVCAAC